jgi:hypothetical protein
MFDVPMFGREILIKKNREQIIDLLASTSTVIEFLRTKRINTFYDNNSFFLLIILFIRSHLDAVF